MLFHASDALTITMWPRSREPGSPSAAPTVVLSPHLDVRTAPGAARVGVAGDAHVAQKPRRQEGVEHVALVGCSGQVVGEDGARAALRNPRPLARRRRLIHLRGARRVAGPGEARTREKSGLVCRVWRGEGRATGRRRACAGRVGAGGRSGGRPASGGGGAAAGRSDRPPSLRLRLRSRRYSPFRSARALRPSPPSEPSLASPARAAISAKRRALIRAAAPATFSNMRPKNLKMQIR